MILFRPPEQYPAAVSKTFSSGMGGHASNTTPIDIESPGMVIRVKVQQARNNRCL